MTKTEAKEDRVDGKLDGRRVRKPDFYSADVLADNLAQMKELFPSAWSEGKLDFEVLRQLLGDSVDERAEKYGLNWHGKRRVRQLALTPSTGTLRPCPDDSVDWNTTQNVMIEGDNLEVLKLLQKSYMGRVKLIYIDPPYNTGKDFVYPDDYRDNLRNYLEVTGQFNSDHKKISSNPETSGRFHTNWLNMMYPRLFLARNLLRDEGILLVSIDDTEVHNLRFVCDDVFGSENFCGTFVWEKKKKPSFLDRSMGSVTDYVVAYAKNRPVAPAFVSGSVEMGKKYPFNNAGNPLTVLRFPPRSVSFAFEDQVVQAQDMSQGNIITELLDDVYIEDGVNSNEFRLRGEWRYSQEKLHEFVSSAAEISISRIPFRPNYVNRSAEMKKTANLLSYRINGVPTNEDATQEMRSLFGSDVMSYPKPFGLIKYFVRAMTTEDDIVMDFFAGSGTTASGVLRQCLEDGLPRRYMLVQLPEPLSSENKDQRVALRFLDNEGKPPNIAELTKEYLRRTVKNIRSNSPMFAGDLGFRVFRLDSTNIRTWKPDSQAIEASLALNVDCIKEGRTEHDILYEVLLKFGKDLCAQIDIRFVADKQIFVVDSGTLLVCLDASITVTDSDTLGLQMSLWAQEQIAPEDVTCVFRDSAFVDDIAKVNLLTTLQNSEISSVWCI